MTCNNMPRFKVTDDGIIRRFITIKMDKKIEKQDKHFLEMIEEDIPNIIREALDNPFRIEDFAEEQYLIFENDPQWGYGYGDTPKHSYWGENDYEKYHNMCKSLGYNARNKANFDKFIELAKIYHGRIKCDTTLSDSPAWSGTNKLEPCDDDTLPF